MKVLATEDGCTGGVVIEDGQGWNASRLQKLREPPRIEVGRIRQDVSSAHPSCDLVGYGRCFGRVSESQTRNPMHSFGF